VGKFGIAGLALLLLFTARCYNADVEGALSGLPLLGAIVSPPAPVPGYVDDIGKLAAVQLPASDPKTWFPAATGEAAPADPLDVARWRDIAAAAEAGGTAAGWAELCKKAATAAGADRAAEPRLGALACSANGTVTGLQRVALGLLAMEAQVALYLRGAPGSSLSAIAARQGELRLACTVEVIARLGGPATAYGQACAGALATAYLEGNAAGTFAALEASYTLLAGEIAKLDPKTASEPGYFEAKK
jgi:hypothetical protein